MMHASMDANNDNKIDAGAPADTEYGDRGDFSEWRWFAHTTSVRKRSLQGCVVCAVAVGADPTWRGVNAPHKIQVRRSLLLFPC